MSDKKKNHPEHMRAETGPIQFGADWPGIFMRGDNAMYYAQQIKIILHYADKGQVPPPYMLSNLRGIYETMMSCAGASGEGVCKIKPFMEAVEDPQAEHERREVLREALSKQLKL